MTSSGKLTVWIGVLAIPIGMWALFCLPPGSGVSPSPASAEPVSKPGAAPIPNSGPVAQTPMEPVGSRSSATPPEKPDDGPKLVPIKSLPTIRLEQLQQMRNLLSNAGLPDLPNGSICTADVDGVFTMFSDLAEQAMSSHKAYAAAAFDCSSKAKAVIDDCLKNGLKPPYESVKSGHAAPKRDNQQVVYHSPGGDPNVTYIIPIPPSIGGRLFEERNQKVSAMTEFVNTTVRQLIRE